MWRERGDTCHIRGREGRPKRIASKGSKKGKREMAKAPKFQAPEMAEDHPIQWISPGQRDAIERAKRKLRLSEKVLQKILDGKVNNA